MRVRHFHDERRIERSLEDVFAFFADPAKLQAIAPRSHGQAQSKAKRRQKLSLFRRFLSSNRLH
jgi:ligand-binding SRPBCC domain-containing protein